MRKLILSVIAVLFITTSAWALTDLQVKKYVGKHYEITKKLKAIKVLRAKKVQTKKTIRQNYNNAAMIQELLAIDAIYNPQISDLNAQYNTLVGEIENQ